MVEVLVFLESWRVQELWVHQQVWLAVVEKAVAVVVLVPGMGDDVQAIKAGIMEIADVFVVNKADLPGADRVEREVRAMLSLGPGKQPAIVKTVATEGTGVPELAAAIGAGQEAYPTER